MSLHHLDPRQAGTGTAPDVHTGFAPKGKRTGWWAMRIGDHVATVGAQPTEQAALHAARQAAGFGHVAEQPCTRYQRTACSWGEQCSNPTHESECRRCAWPKARHPGQP